MTLFRKTPALLLMFVMMVSSAWAQQSDADSTSIKGFNALDFANQGKWRAGNKPFENKRWCDNLFIQTGVGFEGVVIDHPKLGIGTRTSIAVGKFFSATNAARLDFTYRQNDQPIGNPLKRYGVSASHMFNLSAYMFGYNPNRRFEFSSIEGLGWDFASMDEERASGIRVFLGLQTKYQLNKNFDIFAEPIVSLNNRSLMFTPEKEHVFNLSYGLDLGLRYIFRDASYRQEPYIGRLVYGNFYSASIGMQMQPSNLEGAMLGPTVNLSMGRWIIPGLGIKLTGLASTDTWHRANYDSKLLNKNETYVRSESTSYLGGRLEAVFDPLVFFKRIDEQKKYQVRVSAGGEMGWLSKANYDKPIHENYRGMTGGVQFGYRWDEDKLIYIEPRYSYVYYAIPYEKILAFKNFADHLISLNIGVELASPTLSRKSINDSMKGFFRRVLLVSVEAGANLPIQSKSYNETFYIDYQLGALFTYLFTPTHSVGLHLDVNRVSMDQQNGYRQYNLITTGLQYRYDLTNQVLGYDPERKVQMQFFAGPLLTFRRQPITSVSNTVPDNYYGDYDIIFGNEEEQEKKTSVFPGLEAGFTVQFNLKENFGFYVSPQLRIYPSDLLKNDLPGADKICSVMAGFTFTL